jgi:phosphoserine phosphatase
VVRAVAFFDVDGTLVPGISSAVHLAGYLGHAEAVAEAEAGWDAGLFDARYVEEIDARGWAGTSETQIREWLVELPLVDGIADVVEWCVERDVVPALATLAWHPVGVYLCETFGFVEACGPTLEVRDGVYTGSSLTSYDQYVKRDFALKFAPERPQPWKSRICSGGGNPASRSMPCTVRQWSRNQTSKGS